MPCHTLSNLLAIAAPITDIVAASTNGSAAINTAIGLNAGAFAANAFSYAEVFSLLQKPSWHLPYAVATLTGAAALAAFSVQRSVEPDTPLHDAAKISAYTLAALHFVNGIGQCFVFNAFLNIKKAEANRRMGALLLARAKETEQAISSGERPMFAHQDFEQPCLNLDYRDSSNILSFCQKLIAAIDHPHDPRIAISLLNFLEEAGKKQPHLPYQREIVRQLLIEVLQNFRKELSFDHHRRERMYAPRRYDDGPSIVAPRYEDIYILNEPREQKRLAILAIAERCPLKPEERGWEPDDEIAICLERYPLEPEGWRRSLNDQALLQRARQTEKNCFNDPSSAISQQQLALPPTDLNLEFPVGILAEADYCKKIIHIMSIINPVVPHIAASILHYLKGRVSYANPPTTLALAKQKLIDQFEISLLSSSVGEREKIKGLLTITQKLPVPPMSQSQDEVVIDIASASAENIDKNLPSRSTTSLSLTPEIWGSIAQYLPPGKRMQMEAVCRKAYDGSQKAFVPAPVLDLKEARKLIQNKNFDEIDKQKELHGINIRVEANRMIEIFQQEFRSIIHKQYPSTKNPFLGRETVSAQEVINRCSISSPQSALNR